MSCLQRIAFVAILLTVAAGSAAAEDRPTQQPERPASAEPLIDLLPPKPPSSAPQATPTPSIGAADRGSAESICLMIEAAAQANGLPLEFFARVIWQESRFRADAVGPLTRRGTRAQGIAQFMPGTAAERGLLDPFDPVHALPKSAEFLRELRSEFGNLGLAAAAYNAGPQRVRDWLAGSGNMPAETRNYVAAITGASIEDWAPGSGVAQRNFQPMPNCRDLMALLKRAPNPFVQELERRVNVTAASAWGVQLSAGFSRSRALAAYARLANRYGKVLAGRDPSILATTLRSRGTRAFYQIRVGADTRAGADDLCSRIRQAGGPCMVLRNPRSQRSAG